MCFFHKQENFITKQGGKTGRIFNLAFNFKIMSKLFCIEFHYTKC
uniref:Uncharacterized protein n=1 Tax=Bartonella schoenbuchensis (strain DSM 13525 / NCTC 13165 / R1) TaxID=687861 RepID=E6YYK4_BARSR|nr:hypothetical protein B11C_20292 [Bartonella schoenbuchensis R1]